MPGAIIALTRRALARKAWPVLNGPILAMLLGPALCVSGPHSGAVKLVTAPPPATEADKQLSC